MGIKNTNDDKDGFSGPFTTEQRKLVDSLPDAVLLTDASGNIYDANSVFCEMMGFPRSELIGRHVAQCVDPEDLKKRPPRVEEFLRNRSIRAQRLFVRKDGSKFWVDYSSRRVSDRYSITIIRPVISEPGLAS